MADVSLAKLSSMWLLLDRPDMSTLVQVMAWCCQATSHYLSQCWPRSMSPYGVTRPQWVDNEVSYSKFQTMSWLLWCIIVTLCWSSKHSGMPINYNQTALLQYLHINTKSKQQPSMYPMITKHSVWQSFSLDSKSTFLCISVSTKSSWYIYMVVKLHGSYKCGPTFLCPQLT